ncbi:MAG: hypothetical protein P8Y23_07280 [Candidatus Lokiarchaeota archaeon]
MELIKDHLLSNETLLWETHSYSKFDQRYSILIPIPFLFLNIFFFVATRGLEVILYPLLFMFNSTISVVIVISIYILVRDKKNGQLEWSDYKKYHSFAILTNKRWIQKDLRVIDMKDTDDHAKNVEHYKDIVFVSLDSIKLIEIIEQKELGKWKYFISLYFSYNKKKPKNGSLGAYISSKSPNQIIVQTLKTLLTIKHEEINQVHKNKKIYQFYC